MTGLTFERLIGANLRDARHAANMSQAELGQALKPYLGRAWSRQAVSQAESGFRAFAATELLALSRVLGVTISRLTDPPINLLGDIPFAQTMGEKVSITTPGGEEILFKDWRVENTDLAWIANAIDELRHDASLLNGSLERVLRVFEHVIEIRAGVATSSEDNQG